MAFQWAINLNNQLKKKLILGRPAYEEWGGVVKSTAGNSKILLWAVGHREMLSGLIPTVIYIMSSQSRTDANCKNKRKLKIKYGKNIHFSEYRDILQKQFKKSELNEVRKLTDFYQSVAEKPKQSPRCTQ